MFFSGCEGDVKLPPFGREFTPPEGHPVVSEEDLVAAGTLRRPAFPPGSVGWDLDPDSIAALRALQEPDGGERAGHAMASIPDGTRRP
jgi:hypothetical protein